MMALETTHWDNTAADWEYHSNLGHTPPGYFEGIPFKHIQQVLNNEFFIDHTDKILDIPSGANPFAYMQNVHPWQVTAADISYEMLKRNPSLNKILLNMNDVGWNLPKNTFDMATSFFGLRYTTNSEIFLANTARLLRPNGRIVFIDFETKTNYYPNNIEYRCIDFDEVAAKAREWFDDVQVRTIKHAHAPVKMITAIKI